MFRSCVHPAFAVRFCLGILRLGLLFFLFCACITSSNERAFSGQEVGHENGTAIRSSHAVLPAGLSEKPMAPGEMEQFFDPLISAMLAKYQIPGATVSIVKDGRLVFAKGYGIACVEENIPVRAEQTLFRIGSTSKLFTWTAVMQLAEQGKLDLDADVNTYLDGFQIPATYPQPVTLRHLMTHTSGFEEWNLGMLADSPDRMLPLKDYVARYVPARVRAPGQVTAYSNYGSALAGYIVEQVSGMSFEKYIEQNIFRPLGMERSTFRQHLPAGLAQDLARGYSILSGSFKMEPFAYLNAVPAGGMSSTAVDMARFMIAHLQNGRYGDEQILQPATVQQMHQRQFANDPRLNGFSLGFFDMQQNQQHVLEHGGSLPPYNTMLALLPEQNIGLFVSFNGLPGIAAPAETLQAFLDHYYPVDSPIARTPPAVFSRRAAHFAGAYRMTRSNDTKLEKSTAFMGLGFASVAANPDGTLGFGFTSPRGRIQSSFVEISPLVFQEVNGAEKIIFQEDASGKITYLFLNSAPHYALERIAWYETPQFFRILLAACLGTFLSALLSFAIELLRRRWPDRSRIAVLVFILFAVLLPAGIWRLQTIQGAPGGLETALRGIQTLTLALPLLAVLLVVFAIRAWTRRKWSPIARVHYTLIAIMSAASVWLLNMFNLVGYLGSW